MIDKILNYFGYNKEKTVSQASYVDASVSLLDGWGQKGSKPPPFNYSVAIKKFTSWVFTGITLNANAAAATRLKLFVRKKKGIEEKNVWDKSAYKPISRFTQKFLHGDLEDKPSPVVLQKANSFGSDFYEFVDFNNPILQLLNQVNPDMNGFDLLQLLFVYIQLTGNAYLHVVTDDQGVPSQLYIMPSQWTSIITDKQSSEFLIDGYLYGANQNKINFFRDEVIHFKLPNPSSLYYGKSKIEPIWDAININQYSHDYKNSVYNNQGRPDYVILIKNVTDKTKINRFQNKMNNYLQGAKKAGKMIAVSGDVEFKALNFPPREVAFDEKLVIEEISSALGVPVDKLRQTSPTRANSQQANTGWARDCLYPLLKIVEEKLNEKLIPLFGAENDAILVFSNPVPEDNEFILRRNVQLVRTGIMTTNEARKTQGLEDIEAGDTLRYNGQSFEKLDHVSPGFAPKQLEKIETKDIKMPNINVTSPDIKVDLYNQNYMNEKEIEEVKLTPLGKFLDKVENPLDAKQLDSNPIILLQKAIYSILSKQKRKVLGLFKSAKNINNLEIKKGYSKTKIETAVNALNIEFIEKISPELKNCLIVGAKEGLKKIKLSPEIFDVANPEVTKYISKKTIKLSGEVNKVTVEKIGKTLAQGMEKGETISQLRKRIMENSAFNVQRSELISRAESASAYVNGEKEGWKQSGQVSGTKILISPGACEFCRAIANENREVPLGENYYNKGDSITGVDGGTMKFDHEDVAIPIHPNCRCDASPQLI